MSSDKLKGKQFLKAPGHFIDEATEQVEAVKRRHSIAALVEGYGRTLKKSSTNGHYMTLCLLHDDHDPSMLIDETKGRYHCFGCGADGDIIDLVRKMEGLSFKEAIRKLEGGATGTTDRFRNRHTDEEPIPRIKEKTSNLGTTGGLNKPDADKERIPRIKEKKSEKHEPLPDVPPDALHNDDPPPETHESDALLPFSTPEPAGDGASIPPLNTTAEAAPNGENPIAIGLTEYAEYLHKRLYESKAALECLEKRGITDKTLYERFQIGYADGSILAKLSDNQKEQLVRTGIIKKRDNGSYYEHFHGCIVFPITDDSGRVVGMYGRRLDDREPKHLYLPGPHLGIPNKKASKVYDEIALVEGIIDALSLIQKGIENVQPLYGVNGFTAEHLQTLKDDNVKTIVLALDNDEAGHKAAESLKSKLLDEGFAVKTIFPKLTKDWNEELLAGLDKETFRLLVEEAPAEKKKEPEKSFDVKHDGIKDIFTTEHIVYEIVGAKELFVTNLRVNVKATYGGESYYDNADLASGRSRRGLSETLAQLFSVEYKIVERDLTLILEHYAQERDRKLAELGNVSKAIEVSAEDRELALPFLMNRDMFGEIIRDLETLGYVGEDLNKILLYLCASSRILDDPISVMIVSQSASGKSLLVSTIEKLLPPEDVISATSLSDQALNYIVSMLHKFFNLGEAVHSEAIEHQIRDMLSLHMLSRHVAVKDEKTGRTTTEQMKTPAIVAAVMTTTRQNINPENASRFFVINTDESKEQTHRIHAAQRGKYTLEQYRINNEVAPVIIRKHQAAQRLLKKIAIANDFMHYLDFPDTIMRVRRDHARFIDLIACVCFLRQYQKEIKNNGSFDYIECDIEDYRIAYNIMINGVLASSMIELPKGAVEIYESIRSYAREAAKEKHLKPEEVSFTQRDIRELSDYGQTWLKMNMRLLVDYEYITIARGGRERAKAVYRLREDESISKINLSMIPTPEDMEKLIHES